MIKLEHTEKYLCATEDEAELFIEQRKKETETTLVDYKISLKETKESEYYVVTIKERALTLAEGKEKLCV